MLLDIIEVIVSADHAARPENALEHLKLPSAHKTLPNLGEQELLEDCHLEKLLRLFLQKLRVVQQIRLIYISANVLFSYVLAEVGLKELAIVQLYVNVQLIAPKRLDGFDLVTQLLLRPACHQLHYLIVVYLHQRHNVIWRHDVAQRLDVFFLLNHAIHVLVRDRLGVVCIVIVFKDCLHIWECGKLHVIGYCQSTVV